MTKMQGERELSTGRQKQATALMKTLEPQKKAMRSLSASRH